MAKVELNPQVKNEIIQTAPNERIANYFKKTVLRYSKSGSICQKLKNFFLSFFGQSDWQKTLKATNNHVYEKLRFDLAEEGLDGKEINKVISKVKKQASSLYKSANNQLLINLVKKQNNKSISTEEEEEKLKEMQNKFEATVDAVLYVVDTHEEEPLV